MSQKNSVAKPVVYNKGFCGSFESRAKTLFVGEVISKSKVKKGHKVEKCQARVDFVDGVPVKPFTKFFEKRDGTWTDRDGNPFYETAEKMKEMLDTLVTKVALEE